MMTNTILRLSDLAHKTGLTEGDLLTMALAGEIYLSVNYSGHYTARRFKDHPPGTAINEDERFQLVTHGKTSGQFLFIGESDAGRFISLGPSEGITVARLLGADGMIYTLTDAEHKPTPCVFSRSGLVVMPEEYSRIKVDKKPQRDNARPDPVVPKEIGRVLTGWKEITAHMGASVSTAKRYAKQAKREGEPWLTAGPTGKPTTTTAALDAWRLSSPKKKNNRGAK